MRMHGALNLPPQRAICVRGYCVLTRQHRASEEEAKWRYTYDTASKQVREEDGMGNVTARAYDEVGNRVCEKKAKGQPKLAHGGARGLALTALLLVACEGSHVTRWTYDEQSRLVSTRDALGGLYTFVYDAGGALVARQDALEHLTTYTHDVLGRRVAEHQHLDKHGRVQAGDRDRVPRHEKNLNPADDTGTLTRTWVYDSNGNPRQYTDAKASHG